MFPKMNSASQGLISMEFVTFIGLSIMLSFYMLSQKNNLLQLLHTLRQYIIPQHHITNMLWNFYHMVLLHGYLQICGQNINKNMHHFLSGATFTNMEIFNRIMDK